MANLTVSNLTVTRGGQTVVRDVSLSVDAGDLLVLEGRNGAGKSSILLTIMGHPSCVITTGDISFDGKQIVDVPTYERARRGLFLAHQEPVAIGGVTFGGAVRAAIEARDGAVNIPSTQMKLREAFMTLGMDPAFSSRFLNEGFSGGEKKKGELAQMILLAPKVVLLDEVDSGLDAQAKTVAAEIITALRAAGTAFVVVTHSPEFAAALNPSARLALEAKGLH